MTAQKDDKQKSDYSRVFRDQGRSPSSLFAAFVAAGAAVSTTVLNYFVPAESTASIILILLTSVLIMGFVFYIYRRGENLRYKSLEIALEYIKGREVTIENFREIERTKDQIEFDRNVARPLVLRHIETAGFDMFGGFTWALQPRINILLGRNGYGKTRLLQTVAAALAKDSTKSDDIFKNSDSDAFIRLTTTRVREDNGTNPEEVIEWKKKSFVSSIGKVPILAILDSRFINKSRTDIGSVEDEFKDVRNHGSHHFLYQKPYESVIQNFLYQACIDFLENRSLFGNNFDMAVLQLIRNTVRALTDRSFEFNKIQSTGQQGKFTIDVIIEGDTTNPIPIQNISQGTQSVLAIFGLIFTYLKLLHPHVRDQEVRQQPAIVIIDEIDAHLHPVWQQQFVGLLRETFPRTQFILTAHSPLVVAGCREKEVTVLRREEEKLVLFQFSEDFIGWEAEAIYRKVFNIEERDQTYKHFIQLDPEKKRFEDRIRQLEGKSQRSPTDEQELSDLYEKIHYIDRAREAQTRRVQTWDLENQNTRLRQENAALKMEIERLRAPSAPTAQ
jgi:predicted ATP-binding protein involved in virulence